MLSWDDDRIPLAVDEHKYVLVSGIFLSFSEAWAMWTVEWVKKRQVSAHIDMKMIMCRCRFMALPN